MQEKVFVRLIGFEPIVYQSTSFTDWRNSTIVAVTSFAESEGFEPSPVLPALRFQDGGITVNANSPLRKKRELNSCRFYTDYFSRVAQQTNICLPSIVLGAGFEPAAYRF